ncbi:hypothetical protein NQZ68_008409 [Dissostichus eleginoides]|nr:hypothetical protein NQZ68_008409 [Dissostichus eleginoides]
MGTVLVLVEAVIQTELINLDDFAKLKQNVTWHSYPTGKIQVMGDLFQFILDLGEDGAVTAVTHFLPSMQTAIECGPQISVTMSMESSGALTVRAHRLLSSPPCV